MPAQAVIDGSLRGLDLIAAARAVHGARLAVTSSFGIESAVLLSLVAELDRDLPVLFIDTGKLFAETLTYRDDLVAHLGLRAVETLRASPDEVLARDPADDLWFDDPDSCCDLRKVRPLAARLVDFDALVDGRKRAHGADRAHLDAVSFDGRHFKISPLVDMSADELAVAMELRGLPPHPLAARGYRSIGCITCSDRARPGEGARDGRWRGLGKTECGIHRMGTQG